jgi:tetratricopeptide (TPR) repeat protein
MTFRHILFLMMGALILAAGSGWAEDLLEQGLAAQKARNHEQAVELLGQLVKQDPHQPQAWLARAQSLSALGRRQQALVDLEKGLATNPRNPGLLLAKGKILREMERRPEAIATLNELLALEPQNVEALKERAEDLINEAELDKAMADLTRALSLAPKDPWIYHKMGMTELCLNHYGKAVEDFSTAIRLSPKIPLFYFSRGELYLRHLHNKARAKADFEKGCTLGHPLCCNELEMLKAEYLKTSKPENERTIANRSCFKLPFWGNIVAR